MVIFYSCMFSRASSTFSTGAQHQIPIPHRSDRRNAAPIARIRGFSMLRAAGRRACGAFGERRSGAQWLNPTLDKKMGISWGTCFFLPWSIYRW